MQVLIVLSILCIVLSIISIILTMTRRRFIDNYMFETRMAAESRLMYNNERMAKLEKCVHERLMTDIIKTGDDVTLRYDSQDKWKVVGVSTDVDDAAQE